MTLGYLPLLQQLIISNTNITTEVIKILKKNSWKHLGILGFTKQKHFDYGRLIKEIAHFRIKDVGYSLTVRGTYLFDKSNFIYLSHISKIFYDKPAKLYLCCIGQKPDI